MSECRPYWREQFEILPGKWPRRAAVPTVSSLLPTSGSGLWLSPID
jgi:hypothetical protein